MNLRRWFRRRTKIDSGALNRALTLPVPELSRDIPFDTRIPLTAATTVIISHAFFLAAVYGLSRGAVHHQAPSALELAGVALALLLVCASSLAGGGLNPDRRLHVTEEGIRVDRTFGSQSVAWWNVTAVRARPDLSELQVEASGSRLTIHTSGMKEDARASALLALRARLDPARPIDAWVPSRLSRESIANVAGAAGSMLFLTSIYLAPALHAAQPLGMRCSGPSSYFDTRFGLPPGQRGCVVIRISGAAARAGVRLGDRLIAMNGAPITSGLQFNDRFYDEAADSYDLTVVRAGETDPINIRVKLVGGPSPSTPDTDPIAWFLRARGNPDLQQSIQQYTRAIQLAPDFDLAYAFRGELELESDDITAALADLQQALVLNPASAEANLGLANYYQGQVFVDPAVPKMYVARAMEIDGCAVGFQHTNLDCNRDYAILADLLRFRADTPGSIDAAKQAIPYYPRAASPLYELALSYEIAGDKAQATSYARQYLSSSAADRSDAASKGMQSLLKRVASNRH